MTKRWESRDWCVRTSRLGYLGCGLGVAVGLLTGVEVVWAQGRTANTTQAATAQAATNQVNASGQTKATGKQDEFPAVLAVVNGQTISREQLAAECIKRYGDQVLDNMLNKYLILQACQARKLTITQQDVDEEISRIASRFKLTTTLYLKLLQDERSITPEQYSSEVVWPMLALRRLVADQIQVTQQEIDRAYQSEYGTKVQVRMIAVKDRAKADTLLKEVTANPDAFRRVAKEQSEDPATASVEGLLPPLRQYSGDEVLESIAFKLQPGQISQVFQVADMYVILQCVRYMESPPLAPQSIPAIRQGIEDQVRDEKLGQTAEQLFESLKKESNVIRVLGDANMEKQYPGVVAFINQQPVPVSQLETDCIRRHGREVLKGEINRKVLETALRGAKLEVVQADIDSEIARAADMMGFIKRDGSPDVQAWLQHVVQENEATVELYVRDAVWPSVALKKLVASSVQLTEDDMQKGFQSNFGPRAEVLAIVLSNQRTAHEVWELARAKNTEEDFGKLAAQYSIEPVSRANFGKVPPVRRYSGNPVLEEQAFALKPGELSGIVALGDQYVIMRSQGFTKPVVQDYAAVKDELAKELLEKKLRSEMEARLDTLMKDAQIDNFLEKTTQSGRIETAAAPAAAVPTKTR
jgi:parvulin-like peptidyl-prolyl isomerase